MAEPAPVLTSEPVRVLLVEDSADDAELILEVLRLGGYAPAAERVETVETMRAALKARRWDLIVADYSLPRFDAIAALKVLHESGLDLPFIVVSGVIGRLVGEEVAVEAMKAGAHDYILKGKLTRLVPAVRRELREAQVRREMRRAEGKRKQLLARLRSANGELALAALRAEEQAERAEQAARELSRLAAIVESSDEAILSMTLDGVIQNWNPGAERLYGYSAGEIEGQSVSALIPPDRPTELARILKSIRRGEPVTHFETVRVRKDGSLVDVMLSASPLRDRSGRITGVSWISYDISNRKTAEVVRRRAGELETIMESIPDALFVCDSSGRIVEVNEAGLRMAGLSREEVAMFTLFDLLQRLNLRHPNGQPLKLEETALSRALHGETVRSYEELARNVRTKGDGYLLVSAAPLLDGSGNVIGAVEVFSDISYMKEVDKLKDQFISVAAHELKTPVAIMRGFAQWLLRSAEGLSERQRKGLEAIDRGSHRIDGVVRDLLDISKLHAGRLELETERVDLTAMIGEVADRLALTAPKRHLRLSAAEPVIVQGDRGRLEQVIVNLLENAIKFSPQGDDIDVSVAAQQREAIVSVRDHGVGIPRENQSRIFQRFYRAHDRTPYDYGGMGVGLYISKEIVERHGGRMWFDSEEGKGSTFYFSLPLV